MSRLVIAIYFLFLFAGCVTLSAQSEELFYDVYDGDEQIGWMKMSKHHEGNITKYLSLMDLNVDLFVTNLHLQFKTECRFEAGKLVHAEVKNLRNGSVHNQTVCTLDGNRLKVDRDGKVFYVEGPITNCILMYYFQSPDPDKHIFSERWGTFFAPEKLSSDHFMIRPPNGGKTYYKYASGVCTYVRIEHTLATLIVKLRR